jgi:two-component system sensor histidine kinase TctE
MPKSLRHKLLQGLLVPLSLLWLAGAVVAYYLALKYATVANDRALFDSTRSLAEQVHLVDGKATVQLPRAALEVLLSDEHDQVYYQVTDQDGRLVTGNAELPTPTDQGKMGIPLIHDGSIHRTNVRIASLYQALGNKKAVLIQTAETLNKRKILAEEILTGVILPQFILILLAAFFVWRGVERGLMPLKQLREEIATRSHRNLSPVPETNVPQEVAPIIRAINELMSRLGSALEIQQRFMANATHQLRTPLACLQTQTELALRQNDTEQLKHILQQLNTSSKQATRLVTQMLALARVDPGADRAVAFGPLDLNAFAKEITASWVPLALSKNIDLGFEGSEEPLLISGDAMPLKMLLDNLIDNAIRYCFAGGHVTVRVEGGQDILLTVENEGSIIPPEERERVFQRFYRILETGGEGSGLGLAIVAEIALLHDARVSIGEPLVGKGTTVSVIFKRLQPSSGNIFPK